MTSEKDSSIGGIGDIIYFHHERFQVWKWDTRFNYVAAVLERSLTYQILETRITDLKAIAPHEWRVDMKGVGGIWNLQKGPPVLFGQD